VRITLRVTLLIAFWLLAWGEVSVANVASGLVLAPALLLAFPPRRRTTGAHLISPIGVARLLLYVLGQLVTSNVLVAREVVSRRSRIRAGVIAYPVQHPSDEVLTLITNILALTPGTMTVEATTDPAVIYVHFLLLSDLEGARRAVARLERLAVAALGGPGAVPGSVGPPAERAP
jgi:multicomponent Na+:H+ antiporter subunit E